MKNSIHINPNWTAERTAEEFLKLISGFKILKPQRQKSRTGAVRMSVVREHLETFVSRCEDVLL